MSRHKSPAQRLPNSFMSSYRIHETLVGSLGGSGIGSALQSQFERYCTCLMVVQFDIDIGPDLKIIRPSNVEFSEDEFRLICFSALPERLSADQVSDVHDDCTSFHLFSFNHRTTTTKNTTIHGNVLFAQKRDASRVRGYLQEALVLLSPHRMPQLFHDCLWAIYQSNDFVNLSLDRKIPILDTAIGNIANWPEPVKNHRLEMGFLGQVLMFTVPPNNSVPLTEQGFVTAPVSRWNNYLRTKTMASNNAIDLYMLYETLVLTQRPVIVFGNDPTSVSLFIDLAVDLIRPLPFPENRIFEYLTIHSSVESYGIWGSGEIDAEVHTEGHTEDHSEAHTNRGSIPEHQEHENAANAEDLSNKAYPELTEGFMSDSRGPIEPLKPSPKSSTKPSAKTSKTFINNGCIYGVTNPLLLKSILNDTVDLPQKPYVVVLNMNSVLSSNDLDAKLASYIRRCNRAISKDRLLAPSHKLHSKIYRMDSSVQDHSNHDVHFAVRFHFATLTSKLMAPLTSYFKATKGLDVLQFDYTQFYLDMTELQKAHLNGTHATLKSPLVPTEATPLFIEPSLASTLGSYLRASSGTGALSTMSNAVFYRDLSESEVFKGWLESNGVVG